MIYTTGNVLANFLAAMSLVSAFIIGYFNNEDYWLLVTALLVAGAYWTKKYKSTGDTTAKASEFFVALAVCAALYFAGRFVSGSL